MSAEDQKDDVTAETAPVSPGALLKAARLASGRPLADILTETRFTQRNIEALESDQYDSLPGASYARGYMRRYAECLGLDPNDMVARMNTLLGTTYQLGKPVQASVLPEPVTGPKKYLLVGMAILAAIARTPVLAILSLLLIGSLVFGTLFWRGDRNEPLEATSSADVNAEITDSLGNLPPAGPDVPAPATAPALPADTAAPAALPGVAPGAVPGTPASPTSAAGLAAPGLATPATPGVAPSGVATPGSVPATGTAPATGPGAAAPTQLAPGATPTPTAAGALPSAFPSAPPLSALPVGTPPRTETLTFKFVGQSWISVRDATGQELVYGLKNAGQTVNVTGQAPFSINIGKVAFTTLTRNGTPVNLTPYQRGEIASFRLNP